MRVYYLQAEYEPGKHQIVDVWSEKFYEPLSETNPDRVCNQSYNVLEIDEKYNPVLCAAILRWRPGAIPGKPIPPDRFYVGPGNTLYTWQGIAVSTVLNAEKEAFKLSALHGLTQAQLEAYIDANVTDLPSAKIYLKKLSAVVWLLKQTGILWVAPCPIE